MARPTKFTADTAAAICRAVEAGNYLATAAALAGVDADTVYHWLQQGQQKGATAEKREFFGALTRARARAEAAAVEAVVRDMKGGVLVEETICDDDGGRITRKFSPPNGAVALKYLQRAFPDRWADRKAIDPPSGDDQGGMGAPSSLKALAERLHEELNTVTDRDDITDAEIVDT
jgi:transposase-like protein